mmetsp:Transcript_28116/g.24850  ORF Transcript_28116/g.24850 Transcript_28116/m.24850 type:complete len:81 (-) Transcript_28116:49-291(-)
MTPTGPEPVQPMPQIDSHNHLSLEDNVNDQERDLNKQSSAQYYVDTRGNHLAGMVVNVDNDDYDFEKNILGSILGDDYEE